MYTCASVYIQSYGVCVGEEAGFECLVEVLHRRAATSSVGPAPLHLVVPAAQS